jgi:PPOX class probable F420-dependent enzyme
MSLESGKYILVTTFRRDGTAVPTPVWVVPLEGGRLGFWTSSGSGKAKRLAHTSRVSVQPCDARGRVKPGSAPIEATAQLVTGSQLDDISRQVKAKYGVQVTVSKIMGKVIGAVKGKRIPYGDRGVVIEPAR